MQITSAMSLPELKELLTTWSVHNEHLHVGPDHAFGNFNISYPVSIPFNLIVVWENNDIHRI